MDYLKKEKQQIPIDLERHKVVREASQLSKVADTQEEGAMMEFKMI